MLYWYQTVELVSGRNRSAKTDRSTGAHCVVVYALRVSRPERRVKTHGSQFKVRSFLNGDQNLLALSTKFIKK